MSASWLNDPRLTSTPSSSWLAVIHRAYFPSTAPQWSVKDNERLCLPYGQIKIRSGPSCLLTSGDLATHQTHSSPQLSCLTSSRLDAGAKSAYRLSHVLPSVTAWVLVISKRSRTRKLAHAGCRFHAIPVHLPFPFVCLMLPFIALSRSPNNQIPADSR